MANVVEEEEPEEKKLPPSPSPSPSTFPLQGDVLEEVICRLPTVDLVPAQYVSTAWQQAVRSALRRAPRSKPWLFLHSQSRLNPSAVATHAYDPHSRLWLRVPVLPQQPLSSVALIRSSPGCNLLYEITGSRLAVCTGGLGAPWRDLGAPRDWRTDPVVAAVGGHVLVAGGTCGFLDVDDPCAVEVHREDGVQATACEPMPDAFRGSASATFLSVAASDEKMYVMERSTGLVCSFDVESGAWGRPALLRPNPSLFSCCIACSGRRLILAGLGRDDGENAVTTLKLWAAVLLDGESSFECEEIGGMPEDMLCRLSGGDASSSLSSVDISVAGDFAYVCKASDPAMFFSCDFAGGKCRWTEVRAPAGVGENPAERYAFTCSDVWMDDLRRVFWSADGGRGPPCRPSR